MSVVRGRSGRDRLHQLAATEGTLEDQAQVIKQDMIEVDYKQGIRTKTRKNENPKTKRGPRHGRGCPLPGEIEQACSGRRDEDKQDKDDTWKFRDVTV